MLITDNDLKVGTFSVCGTRSTKPRRRAMSKRAKEEEEEEEEEEEVINADVLQKRKGW